jgi:hypothetical protein
VITCVNCARQAVPFFDRLLCSECSLPVADCFCEPIGPTLRDAFLGPRQALEEKP